MQLRDLQAGTQRPVNIADLARDLERAMRPAPARHGRALTGAACVADRAPPASHAALGYAAACARRHGLPAPSRTILRP